MWTPPMASPEECIWKAPEEKGLGGAYIERLACGPPKTYLRCSALLAALPAFPPCHTATIKAAYCMLHAFAQQQ